VFCKKIKKNKKEEEEAMGVFSLLAQCNPKDLQHDSFVCVRFTRFTMF
jgi:hypothetical protein